MKYYKIVYGYGEADYLPITSEELVKAVTLHMEGKGKGIFTKGSIEGKDIKRVVPDWHTAMGWNKGWKMLPEDYAEIEHLEKSYDQSLEKASLIAQVIIKENRYELLKLPSSQIATKIDLQLSPIAGIKQLADKMKI